MFTPARSRFLLALACSAIVFACGGGRPGTITSCQHDKDCPAGQGCVQGACQALPCGGCQPDEACGADGKCAPAQGASCITSSCPAAYPCNGSVCAKGCTLDRDCDRGFVCNSQLHSCAQCTFDQQCASVTGKTHCDGASGTCVACNANIDCVTSVGTGHFCDAHLCKPGCQKDTDCSASAGERCDGATAGAPGRCIQCKTNQECSSSAPACDDTGHCVGCFGTTQTAANSTCGAGTPECDLNSKTCVACLPANDATGQDCGYPVNGVRDPHNAQICNPGTHACVPGCTTDAQCGCPRNPSPNGPESSCGRNPDREHCDPKRTTMDNASSMGACVQCRPAHNEDCAYKVKGSQLYSGAYASMNGAHCQNDVCIEGCDTDADCPTSRSCHLGKPGDALNHKCVECACDVTGADPTYCEVTSTGQSACANTAAGNPRVCDKATLLCRKKRQNEQCTASSECGDLDPNNLCPSGAATACVFSSHPGNTNGGDTYCSPTKSYGRCATPCNDFFNNECSAGVSCPYGSSCRQGASDIPPANAYCVAPSCL
jgi:hypothetical protein